MSKETEVRNLTATKQSVLSASALSRVYMSEDVKFTDNSSVSPDGFTMLFENTKTVDIADTKFSGN